MFSDDAVHVGFLTDTPSTTDADDILATLQKHYGPRAAKVEPIAPSRIPLVRVNLR